MTIDVTRHILELLYQHDCVILPGFGGFIAHHCEGRFDRETGQFSPPARELSFNGLLTADDGLLISTLIAKEKTNYSDGRATIIKFVDSLVNETKDGRDVIMKGIGRFAKTGEGKWLFTPSREINFLENSFGLKPVIAVPVQAETPTKRRRQPKVRIDRRPVARKESMPRPVRWTILTSVPVILFLLWGIIFPGSFQHQYASYSGMVTDLFYPAAVSRSNPAPANSSTDLATETRGTDQAETMAERIQIDEPAVEITDAHAPDGLADPESHETAPLPEGPLYYVIGGVFRSEENAIRYVEALANLGYNSTLAGTNSKGLIRVSYDNFPSWDEAVICLDRIKANENPSAWILKY